jgi:hypothetical protein
MLLFSSHLFSSDAENIWVSSRMDLVQGQGEEGIHYLARLNLMDDRWLRHDWLGSLMVLLLPRQKLMCGDQYHFYYKST